LKKYSKSTWKKREREGELRNINSITKERNSEKRHATEQHQNTG
jgi:hypothetical protein